MIAYLQLPYSQTLIGRVELFQTFQGLRAWEIDSPRSVYFELEPWVHKHLIHHLYQALRGIFGRRIRFGAAEQKTVARAAALFRPVPHCTVVTPESTDVFLARLPINLLPGLGQRTTRFLERRGVTSFDAFRRLPGQILKEWFGVSGLILQQFAHGLDPRTIQPGRRSV